MSEILSSFGVIAIELSGAEPPQRVHLGQQAAGEWAASIASDLARLCPEAAALDIGILAALFDPAELLRPRWPRHAELDRLLARAPGPGGGRVVGFGAHDGQLPPSLRPDAGLRGGPLLVAPFVLRGEAAVLQRVAGEFEQRLLDTGMANAATALATQQAFGLRCEHMRYLTLHDLLAMMAMQYEHAGLAVLWPLLEAALFGDAGETWVDTPPEPLLLLTEGQARMAVFDPDAWRMGGYARDATADAETLERGFEHFEARQRQYAAVLAAHGIDLLFEHCPARKDPRAQLREG